MVVKRPGPRGLVAAASEADSTALQWYALRYPGPVNLKAIERKYLAREEPEDLEIKAARGSVLVGPRGRRYVDFLSGWNVGNLGWARKEIRAAIRGFRGPDYVYPEFLYAPWAELARMLAEITPPPGKLQKSFRVTGGTEAVEIALQAAMVHTGRRGFLSIEGSYHGDSFGAMSIGSSDYREEFPTVSGARVERRLDLFAVVQEV